MQTRLSVDRNAVWQFTRARSQALFTEVQTPDDDAGYAAACPSIMQSAIESPLNDFHHGVNVSFAYGEYLFVDPRALQAYYSENFLASMAACSARVSPKCSPDVSPAVQAGALACYCHGISVAGEARELDFEYYHATVAKARCERFVPLDRVAMGISIGSAIIIAVMNAALGNVILYLVKFERQRSHSAQQRSLFIKVLIAQYLNTSITPLIASAEIEWLAVLFGGVIFQHGYPDFTTNWCAL